MEPSTLAGSTAAPLLRYDGFPVAVSGWRAMPVASSSWPGMPAETYFIGEDMTEDKTAADEKALFDEVLKMLASGKDGVEAGFTTTEFYLTALAVALDVLGPHYGFLQGIDSNEQGLIAMILVMWFGALRSWRKRGGPAKLLAEALKAIALARGQAPTALVPIEVGKTA